MKKVIVALSILVLSVCVIAGCSNGTSNSEAKDWTPKKDEIKIDQIDWKVESSVIDKQRRIVFSYTNKSKYEIANLELDLALKSDVTAEILREACESFKEVGWTDKDLDEISNASSSQMATLRMTGEWGQIVASGKTSGEDPMTLGSMYANSLEQYELFEPNMMTIQYVAGNGNLYEETYDFTTKSYSLSNKVSDTNQWSDSELASQLPRPENLLVTEINDTDTRFEFETLGTTPQEFKDYIAACKEKGFTQGARESDSYFYVKSADGEYHLDLLYNDSNGSITAYLRPNKQ